MVTAGKRAQAFSRSIDSSKLNGFSVNTVISEARSKDMSSFLRAPPPRPLGAAETLESLTYLFQERRIIQIVNQENNDMGSPCC